MERPTPGGSAGSGPEDQELEDVLVRALDALEREGPAGLERLLEAHPRHAERARAHLVRAQRLGLLGGEPAPGAAPERLGDFRLLEPLGHGAMGVVYRAVQESLGREVALKLVRPELLWFPGARERFQREVELVGRLAHPGIVPVHAVGDAGGVPCFAMELVRGATLAEVLEELEGRAPAGLDGRDLDRALARRLGEAPAAEPAALFRGDWCTVVARILRELAEALEHAHRRGVLHRDVKPSNVMVTRAGRVLLLDFGLAATPGQQRLTRTGSQLGSLAYMAPERLGGTARELDARADVYALGATGWELCTLRLPYSGSDPLRVQQQAAAAARPRLGSQNPAATWELETVLSVALEPDPARRYPSAAALARDLDNLLARRPIEAREAGPLLRLRRWTQRHPARATAAAALLAATLAGPSLYALQEVRARRDLEAQRDTLRDTNAALAQARDEARSESRRARTNFEALQRAVDTMLARVADETLRDVPRMERVRAELLSEALRFYQDLRAQAPDDPALCAENARLHVRMAEIESLLGELAGAEADLRGALALFAQCGATDPAVAAQAADCRARLAGAQRARGDLVGARASADQALADWRALEGAAAPADVAAGRAQARIERARILTDLGDLEGARAALRGLREELGEAPEQAVLLARALDRAGAAAAQQALASPGAPRARALLAAACDDHATARAVWDRFLTAEDALPALRVDAARNAVYHAIALQGTGALDAALEAFRHGVALGAALAEEFPASPDRRMELANARTNLATALGLAGRDAEARAEYAAAHPLWEALCAAAPERDECVLGLAQVLQGEALAAWREAEPDAARALLVASDAACARALSLRPSSPTHRRMRAKVRETLAELELECGQHAAAAGAARLLLDPALAPTDPALAAALIARCAPLAEEDLELDPFDRTPTADGYREEALRLFEAALAAGRTRAALRADPALANQWSTPGVDELLDVLFGQER